jgi:hypothetical protein
MLMFVVMLPCCFLKPRSLLRYADFCRHAAIGGYAVTQPCSPAAVCSRAAVCSHTDVHSHTAAAMLLYLHAAMPLSVAMCYTAFCSLRHTLPSATMQPPAAICC